MDLNYRRAHVMEIFGRLEKHILILTVLYICVFCTGAYADITDMPSEAICVARCLDNFTNSLDESELEFLHQRPDLTEPHCTSKQSNCSSCLDVCRWSRTNATNCDISCSITKEKFATTYPNSQVEVHRQTCLDACAFSRSKYVETTAILKGVQRAVCPLPTSWPESCHKTCSSDRDCQPAQITKCCQTDICHETQAEKQYSKINKFAGILPIGVCMQVVTTTTGVPPVPGPASVRQSNVPLVSNEDRINKNAVSNTHLYKLELDWSDYYNRSSSKATQTWRFPAVFLVQLRLYHDLIEERFEMIEEQSLPDEAQFSEWRSLVWTTKLGAVLSDLRPGTWYQFRLMAASAVGFGGIGKPSRPIKILKVPEAPSSPKNLTEGTWRIFGNKVELKIIWEPPDIGKSHLKFYKITWRNKDIMNHSDSSLSEYEAKIPKTINAYTIQGLEPGTVYEIHVRAVSLIDGKEWVGPPTVRYFKTVPKSQSEFNLKDSQNFDSDAENECQCESVGNHRHLVKPPFFEDGRLKATLAFSPKIIHHFFGQNIKENSVFHLLWYPKVCIESPTSYVELPMNPMRSQIYTSALSKYNLDNLRFQCHYKLRISASPDRDDTAPEKALDLCFCTPACKDVEVKSGPGPRNCSSSALQVPYGPVDVGYRIIPTSTRVFLNSQYASGPATSQSEIEPIFTLQSDQKHPDLLTTGYDVIISWRPNPRMVTNQRQPKHDTRLRNHELQNTVENELNQHRGYRIVWGPRLVEPIEPEMYSNGISPQLDPDRTESKVIDPQVQSVVLRNLESDTLYIVQVQTIGSHADSQFSSIYFTTPNKSTQTTSNAINFLPGLQVPIVLLLHCLQ